MVISVTFVDKFFSSFTISYSLVVVAVVVFINLCVCVCCSLSVRDYSQCSPPVRICAWPAAADFFLIIFFRVHTIPAYVKVRSDYPSDTEYTFLQQQKRMKKGKFFIIRERRWMDDSTTPMTLGTDCLNPLLSLPSISS